MTTPDTRHLRPLWFGEGLPLLGHLHVPRRVAIDIAVVICAAPFGYENIASHRGLRRLADCLVDAGIASLRFDVPGTGDSDGEQTLDAWRASIGDAVATVRRETRCKSVAIIGVGLGATLALASLDAGVSVDKLILWGGPISGRDWLRLQRATHRITAIEGNPAMVTSAPSGVEELYGFPMTAELANDLATLDLSQVSPGRWPAERPRPTVLLVSRDVSDVSGQLAFLFAVRGMPAQMESWDGLDAMFVEPHLCVVPEELFQRMRSWLAADVAICEPYAVAVDISTSASTRIRSAGAVEETARYSSGDEGLLFSIETRPNDRKPRPLWSVLLTGRAVRHIGPNRIWVRVARELAAAGYASIRLDGRSVGDSDGSGDGLMPDEYYYQKHIHDDIERVMDIAVFAGAREFLITGVCSGATAAFQVALGRRDVRAIVMLNPLQLQNDPEDAQRAKVQLSQKAHLRWHRLFSLQFYLQIVRGETPVFKILGVIYTRWTSYLFKKGPLISPDMDYVYQGFQSLAKKPVDIDVCVSAEDQIAVSFCERHFGADFLKFFHERIRFHAIVGADHTIRPLHAQSAFLGILRSALMRVGKA